MEPLADRHHVLFPRSIYEANSDTKSIRRNRWLVPYLERVGHDALHDEITIVPVFDRFTVQRINRDFEPVSGDYVRSIESLMFSIDEAMHHPKIRSIEIMNAEIIIHALELQIPFIKEFQV